MIPVNLKRLLAGTLRRQLVVGMTLVVAITMSLFVWDLTRRQQSVVLEQQSELATALARSVASSSAVWVASRDFSGLQEVLQSLSHHPDLRHAIVLDLNGQILAHSDPGRRGQYLTDLPQEGELTVLQRTPGLVDVASPVMLADRPIGWVRIGLARDSIDDKLAQVTRGGLFYALIAIVLSIIFASLAGRYLTRRLNAIQRVVDAVQAGDSALRAVVPGDDEAAMLARQFNGMLDTLAQRGKALKESEGFKSIILNSVAAEIAVIDRDGVIQAVNDRWRRFSIENGIDPGKPAPHTDVGTNYLAVCAGSTAFASNQALDARSGIQSVLDGKLSSFSLEYPCHSPHQQRWFTMIVMPLGLDPIDRVVVTHTDITAQKLAQAALEESLEFGKKLIGSMQDGFSVLDTRGCATDANPALCRMTGFTREELMGVGAPFPYWPPEEYENIQQAFRRTLDGVASSYELTFMRKNGQRFPVIVSPSTIKDSRGNILSYIATVKDITERKNAEIVRRESDQRLAVIVDTALDALITMDSIGKITNWNTQAEAVFGWVRDEAIGQSLAQLIVPPPFREAHNRGMARYVAGGASVVLNKRVEMTALRKNGMEFPVELAITPVRVGSELFFSAFLRDISKRKQAEAARAALEGQLRESQKMQAIGTLAGGIAHDFNNALATIMGNVELAREDARTNPLALESLEEIRKAGSRARDLVQQILSFSRRQPTERKLIALAPIIGESARLLRATLPARLALDVHCDENVPAVVADATQIQQVLINLATNSMQAMRSGPGRIAIRLDTVRLDRAMADRHPVLHELYEKCPGETVRLTVSDDGPGMDAVTLPRIFEPFFTTKAVNEGTGLGLSVVHGIVQTHDGAIEVESQPGKGSAFTIYLPICQKQPGEPVPVQQAAVEAVARQLAAPAHILYLDDDESLVFLVQRLLERRGYRVSVFTDQEDALAALRAEPAAFDVVVTDYNMPGKSGLDVARAARMIRADLPVAIATGFIDEALQAAAEGAGVCELIFKANEVEGLCDAFVRLAQSVVSKRIVSDKVLN